MSIWFFIESETSEMRILYLRSLILDIALYSSTSLYTVSLDRYLHKFKKCVKQKNKIQKFTFTGLLIGEHSRRNLYCRFQKTTCRKDTCLLCEGFHFRCTEISRATAVQCIERCGNQLVSAWNGRCIRSTVAIWNRRSSLWCSKRTNGRRYERKIRTKTALSSLSFGLLNPYMTICWVCTYQ